MRIGIINGSHRSGQSEKVANFIERTLQSGMMSPDGQTITTYLLNLADNPLPLWDSGMWEDGNERWAGLWDEPSRQLTACDAYVIVCPEWGGMAPAGLKNLFLLCEKFELAHKPAVIVGVSSTYGGTYPIAELRMSAFKNSYVCFIPDHVIVRDVRNVFNDFDTPESEVDIYIRERLQYNLIVLLQYGAALRLVRASGILRLNDYPYGM